MESRQSHYVLAAIACGVLGALVLGMSAVSAAPSEGEKLAFNRSKGNCIACHAIKGGSSVGNIGPGHAILFQAKGIILFHVKIRSDIYS